MSAVRLDTLISPTYTYLMKNVCNEVSEPNMTHKYTTYQAGITQDEDIELAN